MGVMLIAPSEPGHLVAAGSSSSVPEQYGADILIPSQRGYLIGVQRKTFPDDFLASLYDGRLSTSLVKLSKLDMRILVLEGRPRWSPSGMLTTNDYGRQFSRSQLWGLLFSAQHELGISHHWTADIHETVEFCRDLARWAQKPDHRSLFNRPAPLTDHLRSYSDRDRAIYFLQGVEGWGPDVARRVYDHFGRIPLALDVDESELLAIAGVGKGRVSKLRQLLSLGDKGTAITGGDEGA